MENESLKHSEAEIKKFSKEYSGEKRDVIAGKIKERRAEHFSKKKEVSGEIIDLKYKIENQEEDFSSAVDEIREIEAEISDKKNSIFGKLFNFIKIKQLEKDLGAKYSEIDKMQEDYAEMKSYLEELNEENTNKEKLEDAKKILKDFYTNETEKLSLFEKEEKERDLVNVINKHKTVFIHSINPNFTPSDNSLLKEEVKWDKKLDILIALNPTISTSTIREGDTNKNMWSEAGVVIGRGRIVHAESGDAGTIATGLKNRIFFKKGENIEENIKKSIELRAEDAYNELVVEDPKVIGLYFCNEKNILKMSKDRISEQQMILKSKELDLPIFIVTNGVFFKTTVDEENNKLIKEEPMSPEEISKMDSDVSEVKKEKMIDDIFSDSPFKIKSPEFKYLASRDSGKDAYIELNAKNKKDAYITSEHVTGPSIKYIADEDEDGPYLIKSETFKHNIITRKIRNNKLQIFIGMGGFGTFEVSKNEDYVTETEKFINKIKAEWEKFLSKSEETKKNNGEEFFNRFNSEYEKYLTMTVFHMYGFAEEADKNGDEEIAKMITEKADKIFSKEKYDEILSRRISEKGKFKISREELE